MMSEELGHEYHTAKIRSLDEARDIYRVALKVKRKIGERNVRAQNGKGREESGGVA